jgi:hypothetical protein
MNDKNALKAQEAIGFGVTPRRVEALAAEARSKRTSMDQVALNHGLDPDLLNALRSRWGISYRQAQA